MSFSSYLSKSRPRLQQPPHGFIQLNGIINDQIKIIADPTKDQFWHGVTELKILHQQVTALRTAIELKIQESVLHNRNQSYFESWMTNIVEKQLKQDALYQIYQQLEEMIDTLIHPDGWLVYWGW